MRIIVSPVGSAGDVHPFIGLAQALQRRGHEVAFITNEYFADTVQRAGLEYVELGTRQEFLDLAHRPELWHPRKAFAYICRIGVGAYLRRQYQIIEEEYVPGETVVVSSCLGFGARIAREKLGVPLVTAHLQPAVLWSEYQSPKLPSMPTGPRTPRWLKRRVFRLGEALFINPAVREVTGEFRSELGLPPIGRTTEWWHSPESVLCLFPSWYAPPQPDWPPNVTLTEFPLWDESGVTEVPSDVEEFLSDGTPPIVFTPGSAMRHGLEFFRAAVDACDRLGRRGVLLSRFREQLPSGLPESVRHFDYVPFSQVLPRSAAVVHHGGIGTTAQGLAAGIPQLLMPMAHDQPDNAARLKRFGVGDWLRPSAFRGPAVAQRLGRLLESEQVRRNCTTIADKFDAANGLDKACDEVVRRQLSVAG